MGKTTAVAAAAGGAHGPGEGPRVWGPEDWEGSPTMAMLTAPVARQEKSPEWKEEDRGGPIWRSAFGGLCCCLRA